MVNEERADSKETKSKVSWNLSEAVMIEIGNLLKEASLSYTDGKMQRWFWTLKTIKMRIIPKLNSSERKELLEREHDIRLCQKIPKYRKYLPNHIEKYNELILDLLEDKGFYPQNKEDTTKIN